MFRSIAVSLVVVVGVAFAIRSPFYALLLYLWYAYFRPDQWAYNSSLVLNLNVSLIAGALVLVGALVRLAVPRIRLLGFTVVLFALHATLCAYNSVDPEWSWKYWNDFARVILITLMIPALVSDVKHYRLVIITIALSLGLSGAKEGLVWLFTAPTTGNPNSHPALGDNNGIAEGMMMLVPLLVALVQTAKSKTERLFFGFLTFGVLARALTTYSRGGFLAAAGVASMSIWRTKHRLRAVLGVAMLALVLGIVLPTAFFDRIGTISSEDASAAGRLHYWRVATQMVEARPIFGVGFNAFPKAYDFYDPSPSAYGAERAAHSTWFGTAADLGYPGLALFIVVLLGAYRACSRVIKDARQVPQYDDLLPFAVALKLSFVAYVIAGTFLNSQYSEMFWHFVGLSMALSELHRKRQQMVPALRRTHNTMLETAVAPHSSARV